MPSAEGESLPYVGYVWVLVRHWPCFCCSSLSRPCLLLRGPTCHCQDSVLNSPCNSACRAASSIVLLELRVWPVGPCFRQPRFQRPQPCPSVVRTHTHVARTHACIDQTCAVPAITPAHGCPLLSAVLPSPVQLRSTKYGVAVWLFLHRPIAIRDSITSMAAGLCVFLLSGHGAESSLATPCPSQVYSLTRNKLPATKAIRVHGASPTWFPSCL